MCFRFTKRIWAHLIGVEWYWVLLNQVVCWPNFEKHWARRTAEKHQWWTLRVLVYLCVREQWPQAVDAYRSRVVVYTERPGLASEEHVRLGKLDFVFFKLYLFSVPVFRHQDPAATILTNPWSHGLCHLAGPYSLSDKCLHQINILTYVDWTTQDKSTEFCCQPSQWVIPGDSSVWLKAKTPMNRKSLR